MIVVMVLMVIVINLMVAIMLPMLVLLVMLAFIVTNVFRKHVGCPDPIMVIMFSFVFREHTWRPIRS